MKDGACTAYNYDLESYRNLIIDQRRKERSQARNQAKAEKSDRKAEEEQRKKQQQLQKTLEKTEREYNRLTLTKDRLEEAMATAGASHSSETMRALQEQYDGILRELATAEAAWLQALAETEV